MRGPLEYRGLDSSSAGDAYEDAICTTRIYTQDEAGCQRLSALETSRMGEGGGRLKLH